MSSPAEPFRDPFGVMSSSLNRLFVSAYKLVGFGLLSLILVGIASYIGIHGFYLVHRSWVVPTMISPNDPIVLDLRARIAHEDWMRHKVLAERAALEVQLKKARRVAELERAFQEHFKRSMRRDAASRRLSLKELSLIQSEYNQLERESRAATQALIQESQGQLEKDYSARLIDREQLMTEKYRLAQMAQARLDATQSKLELSQTIRRLAGEIEAFENAAKRLGAAEDALSYEGLALQREHEGSVNEALGAGDEVEALERGLDEMNQAIIHYDEILNTLEAAPMLRATQAKLALAFVPYENDNRIGEGAPVYVCHLGVLFCRRVGRVRAYWEGEVKQAHPVYGRELRGQLAELELDDPSWAKQTVLHVNRPPLLF
jgi:hypothetical protein